MVTAKDVKTKFFLVDVRHISYPGTYSLQNEKILLINRPASDPAGFHANPRRPGFWPMLEKPAIVLHKGCKIASRDIDLMRSFWIVSERCKDAMTSIDPSAFAFVECDCYDDKGKLLEKRWLCAVMRILDVLDEQSTGVTITRGSNGAKGYIFSPYDNIVFKAREIPSGVQIFNMAHIVRRVISTSEFKEHMKLNKIKNLEFKDVSRMGSYK